MKKSNLNILTFLFIVGLLTVKSYGQLARKIEMTDDNRLLGLGTQHIIKSDILNEERPIVISLPHGYEETQFNYPVLYLLDGLQNIKHTVGTVEHLTESGLIPSIIVVGIESLDRNRDLTPSQAGQGIHGGVGNKGISQSGGAPVFLEFLKEELIPFVDDNYRTHPYRIIEGHSLGGLFSVYAFMESPDLFDAFIIEAPALWWNGEEMTEQAKTFFQSDGSLNKTVYFGIGGGDGWGMREELIRYVEVVKQKTPKNFRWLHEEVGDEGHMASRMLLNYNGLKFLFSDLKISDDLVNNFSEESFQNSEQQLLNKYGETARRPAEDYFTLVSALVDNENDKGAITVLKRATEAYPVYVGLLTYLAQLYEKINQKNKAIDTYLLGVEVSKRYKLGQEDDFQIEIERLRKNQN
ncbi:alpha/beta hydrolase [Euzebyella marina]|uniref:Alpha/beta hydrolase n=1 Tax=Euzebyella marina TaxID=1761453 RepID=A0A3G2L513_9FLAO|nr:alpha/beta hydrolase-fold protein [Euzebyella marina]AYN67350.1 alpha/beta hydrolase [Euzebyella marina]